MSVVWVYVRGVGVWVHEVLWRYNVLSTILSIELVNLCVCVHFTYILLAVDDKIASIVLSHFF